MELGLQTLAAAGAVMLVTLQGGKREASRFEIERDKAGDMINQPAFNSYLRGVRKTGASHPKSEEAVADDTADRPISAPLASSSLPEKRKQNGYGAFCHKIKLS